MELKPGYKQTEVGVIPEEWEVKRLGACATFRTGPFGSALHKSDYTDDGVPVINPMHIIAGQMVPTRTMTITEKAASNLSDFRLKTGEIVMGRRGDMGRCAVVQSHQSGWLCGTGSMIIRGGNTDANFLQRVLSSPQVIVAIEDTSVGSTMINLNQSTLAGLRIQSPPLPEQRAIAGALSDVDVLIRAIDQLIAKKRDLKQAVMQQLLTGQKHLPGFHGEWEVKRLGDVAALNRLNVIPASLPTQMFVHFSLPAFDAGKAPVTEPGAAIRSNKFRVPQGAVLVSKLNPRIPRVWAPDDIPLEAIASTEFLVLTSREGTSRRFLFVLCSSPLFCEQMELAATGTTGSHQRISPGGALSLKVSVPVDVEEQTAIAEVLSDMDTELAALEQRRDKTRALKQGMMQELLTGRTRLV